MTEYNYIALFAYVLVAFCVAVLTARHKRRRFNIKYTLSNNDEASDWSFYAYWGFCSGLFWPLILPALLIKHTIKRLVLAIDPKGRP